jgi:uncharacterized protein (DUF169 family)
MTNQQLATTLAKTLELEQAPVALAFVNERPSGVPDSSGPAPSACTFWRRGQTEVFYASAADHEECPVGVMTMGFELPPERAPEAQQLVGAMVELGYFGADEVAHLPGVQKPHRGIVYGPLATFPLEPDVVLVQVSPAQAMILAEASEAVALRESPGLAAMGRPACAAVARAVNAGATTLSLGCIGARTYVELPDDRALVILPAADLERTAERLPALARANQTLATYHAEKKARFERQPEG